MADTNSKNSHWKPPEEGNDEDILITDMSRFRASTKEKKQYEKWKQKLRRELAREKATRKRNNQLSDKLKFQKPFK